MAPRNGSHEDIREKLGLHEGLLRGIAKGQEEILVAVRQHAGDDDRRFAALDARVDKAENDLAKAKGAAGIIAAVVSIGATFVKDLVFPKH